jgi:hypothetical protein
MTYFATHRNDRAAYDGSPSPCDSCPRRAVCKAQQLACGDLSYWLNAGGLAPLKSPEKRIPTHFRYLQIFPGAA